MKIKILMLLLACYSMFPLNLAAADVVGGGELKKIRDSFRLPEDQINLLTSKKDLTEAERTWLLSLTPQQKQQLLEKVFDHMIIPQIKSDGHLEIEF